MRRKGEELEYHKRIGYAKARELYIKSEAPLEVLAKGGRQKGLTGVIREGIAREFIREFLPSGYDVGRGIVYLPERGWFSPEIDAIVYSGSPMMRFGDVVVTEKEQTSLVVEVKSWAGKNDLFGKLKGKDKNGRETRDTDSNYMKLYNKRKIFGEKYVLFIFSIIIAQKVPDNEIWDRLAKISDKWVVVWRKMGADLLFDYGYQVTEFIKTLRNLGKYSN